MIVRLRAVPLQSVESKLGRTGESELDERETSLSQARGKLSRLLPSFPSFAFLYHLNMKSSRVFFPDRLVAFRARVSLFENSFILLY